MPTNYAHNRQRPLAEKYETQIFREEVRAREEIMASQCLAKAPNKKTKITGLKAIAATVVVHVSTSMKQNPGPAAYAFTTCFRDIVAENSDCRRFTTMPQLELEAMIAALNFTITLKGKKAIHTTARWIAETLNDGQAHTWRENGWRKSDGEPVPHALLWTELLRLQETNHAKVVWLQRGATPAMKHCERVATDTFRTKRPEIQNY